MNTSEQRIQGLRDSLKELAELGSPVDLSAASNVSRSHQLAIEQTGGIHQSMIFELEDGRLGYMLDLRITNQTSRPIYIDDKELRLSWKDELFEWLLPHTIKVRNHTKRNCETYEQYQFPGRCGLELPLEDVINHLLTSDVGLPPLHPICGWLLAIGGLMPRNLFHGGWIDGELVITTSDHEEHCEPIRLWTERLQRKTVPTTRKPNPNGNLYEPALNKEPEIRKLDSEGLNVGTHRSSGRTRNAITK